MTREVPLTRGMVAIVDDEDFERLAAFKWSAVEGRNGCFYAQRHVQYRRSDGTIGDRMREMQREVLDPEMVVPRTLLADHRNGDTLDCRRNNLRWATFQVSNLNRRTPKSNTTGYRGVILIKARGRYRAGTRINGRTIWAGYFDTAEDAARAYNDLVLKHHGENARLNVIP